MSTIAAALSVSAALAFSPAAAPGLTAAPMPAATVVHMSAVEPAQTTRRALLTSLAAAPAALIAAAPALAEPPPDGYKLIKDYPKDAKLMLDNMKTATELTRGAPGMEQTVKATRSEMNDFVAFYRRQPKVAGMPSFSTLYTAINTPS